MKIKAKTSPLGREVKEEINDISSIEITPSYNYVLLTFRNWPKDKITTVNSMYLRTNMDEPYIIKILDDKQFDCDDYNYEKKPDGRTEINCLKYADVKGCNNELCPLIKMFKEK